MVAGALGETRAATLTLRSGETTGTADSGTNAGDEATQMQETSASLVVTTPDYAIQTQASPDVAPVQCLPNPVLAGADVACGFSNVQPG